MLTQSVDEAIASSMKAGDTDRLGTLRLLKTSLKNEQIKLGHDLTDDEAMTVLVREAKQRRDSITAYLEAGRPELAAVEEKELAFIEDYLPRQLSETELRALIDEAVKAAGPDANMGQIIGAVKKQAGATADGAAIAKLVRERLG